MVIKRAARLCATTDRTGGLVMHKQTPSAAAAVRCWPLARALHRTEATAAMSAFVHVWVNVRRGGCHDRNTNRAFSLGGHYGCWCAVALHAATDGSTLHLVATSTTQQCQDWQQVLSVHWTQANA